LLVFLANVKMSSRLLGARLDLLWLEARTLSELMPQLMKLSLNISDDNMKYFNDLRAKPVCTVMTMKYFIRLSLAKMSRQPQDQNLREDVACTVKIKTFAKMSRLFDEDLTRHPNTYAWTKLLCFSHVFIPLTNIRFKVICCLELLWLCACNLLSAAVAFLGFQPDLAGMFGAGVFGAGGRATQATDELLAALAADDAFMA
jgi:hypothetical protein